MTTITYDGTTLAADRQATTGSGAKSYMVKIRRVGNQLVGVSGAAPVAMEFFDWLLSGADKDKYPSGMVDEDATAIVIRGGKVFQYETTPYPQELLQPQHAIGSGAHFARAAMHLGKSAKEAIEVAMQFDAHTGGEIDELRPHVLDRLGAND